MVEFDGDKIATEHIYWDQASVLVQVGLLDPTALPISGKDCATKVVEPSEVPSNALIERRHQHS